MPMHRIGYTTDVLTGLGSDWEPVGGSGVLRKIMSESLSWICCFCISITNKSKKIDGSVEDLSVMQSQPNASVRNRIHQSESTDAPLEFYCSPDSVSKHSVGCSFNFSLSIIISPNERS